MVNAEILFCFFIVFLYIREFIADCELILLILIKFSLSLLEILSFLQNWDTYKSEKKHVGEKKTLWELAFCGSR